MKTIPLFLLLFSTSYTFSFNTDTTYFTAAKYGPFYLLNKEQDSVAVFVTVRQVHFLPKNEYAYSDCDYIIADYEGNVMIRNTFTADGYQQLTIQPAQLYVPGVGPVLLIMQKCVPASPGDCIIGQVFGLDNVNNIRPYSEIMTTTSNNLQVSSFLPVKLFQDGSTSTSIDENPEGWLPCIETTYWTGNFTMFMYHFVAMNYEELPISFGRITRHKIQIDPIRAANWRRYIQDSITIVIHPKPNVSEPIRISIQTDSKIDFLDAELIKHLNKESEIWLHVRINGKEGYVEQSELIKLGLPSAG